jgi:SAM-dependent methyltransferase
MFASFVKQRPDSTCTSRTITLSIESTRRQRKRRTLSNAADLRTEDLVVPDLGTVWDLCLSTEYDHDQLVRGLVEWLGPPDGLRVLDCACGSGFPALDLHRLGYDLSCTDASPLMLERFRRKAQAAAILLEPQQISWEELDLMYTAQFDVVLCRGCSLIYAGTWDSDSDPDILALECSVKSLVHCLRPGGRLYVDTTQEDDLHDEAPQWTKHAPLTIDGRRVELQECVIADPDAGARRWMVQMHIDGASFDFERKSLYLPHEKLAGVLREAGLDDVRRADVLGERYAVFVGRKS